MGVVFERDRWELHPSAFLVLFASCFASIFLLPSPGGRGAGASPLFDLGDTAPFLRFQSGFLMLYALASARQNYFGSHVGSVMHPFFHVSVLDTLGTNYSGRRERDKSIFNVSSLDWHKNARYHCFPMTFQEAKLLGNEDCLMIALGVVGIALFIVSYDYQ